MSKDQKTDVLKGKIDPALWMEMKISAICKRQKIYEWLSDAIKIKLQLEKDKMEDHHEK